MKFSLKTLGSIVWVLIFVIGCSKDSGDIDLDDSTKDDPIENPDPRNGDIVSGNPELNNFLITATYENLYAVSTETGQEELLFTFPDLIDLEIVAEYDNGKVFVTADDNSVNAIDVTDKNFVWEAPMLEYKFSSLGLTPPVCLEGVCYASGGFGVVVALDENTGSLKWYYSTDANGETDNVLNEAVTPIVYGDKVYIFSEAGFVNDFPAYIHVLDRQTGQLLDKRELPFDISGTPLVSGNTLFLPAGNLYALAIDTFEVKWVFEANDMGTPFVLGDRLVVQGIPLGQTLYSSLYCLDTGTGNLIWNLDTGFDTIWSPIIVENVVFGVYEKGAAVAFSTNGRPFAVALSDGNELWFNDDVSVDNSPVYANGHLFFHGHAINRSDDIDNNVGLLSMDANTGEVLWINTAFRYGHSLVPLVIADNGVFGPSYYRGH